ncbi:hypothetical protein AGMMS49573_09160 [Endomicrobiia bacterium]|nr:hypothetical protein AGMMS49573_09160 [Endomicrobiia bacterium]
MFSVVKKAEKFGSKNLSLTERGALSDGSNSVNLKYFKQILEYIKVIDNVLK